MEKWQKPLDKFLSEWKDRPYVLGAILTGSRATTHYSERSDFDVYIILSDSIRWRERGNKVIDGLLFEYFANPAKQIRTYFKKEFSDYDRLTSTMFVTGKVIFDRTGAVRRLVREAQRWLDKDFPKQGRQQREQDKYAVSDLLDGLRDLHDHGSKGFEFLYYHTLKRTFDGYAKFLRVEPPSTNESKMVKILEDADFRRQYKIREFPDRIFVRLFLRCLEKKTDAERMDSIDMLAKHVLNKMGGFDIDGWKLRSKLDLNN